MKFKKIIIKLAATEETEIIATGIGDYAYHKDYKSIGNWVYTTYKGINVRKDNRQPYTVTHVPSGLGVEYHLSAKDAMRLVTNLQYCNEKWDGKNEPPESFLQSVREHLIYRR